MAKKKIGEEATCPICGAPIEYYDEVYVDGESVGKEWDCKSCSSQGVEWHETRFSMQTTRTIRGKAVTKSFNRAEGDPIVIEVYRGCASVKENPTDADIEIVDLD